MNSGTDRSIHTAVYAVLVKAYLLGTSRADRATATNHNKQVLRHDTGHVLLAINHAAFLARIMEDYFLPIARLQG